jgi:hypothetical protein
MRLRMILWMCILSFSVWVLPAHAISYKYTTIDYPGEPGSILYGMNSSGTEMVGFYFPLRGFQTDGKVFTPVAVPDYLNTVALGINVAGKIVGWCSPGGTIYHGYVKVGDDFSVFDVPAPGTTNTEASKINDSDQIVGTYYSPSYHGYVKTGDTFYYFDYPSSTDTEGRGINNKGQVVGRYWDAASTFHGYVHNITSNTYATIDYLGGGATCIAGINDLGQMVGYYQDGWGKPQPLAYSGGFFTILHIPGAVSGVAYAIDNHGNVVGSYKDSSGDHGFRAEPNIITPIYNLLLD